MKHITKQEFLDEVWNYELNPNQWVFKGERPVVVDFYASWCGPCNMLSPLFNEMAIMYADKVDFYKVDTEKEVDLSMVFRIKSIPTVMFCSAECAPQMSKGLLSKSELKSRIDELIGRT